MPLPLSRKKPASKPAVKPTKCVACGGTGKSSKGGPCLACWRKQQEGKR